MLCWLLGDSGYTTDLGWGCMLRCGQMMVAQALVNRHLTRRKHLYVSPLLHLTVIVDVSSY